MSVTDKNADQDAVRGDPRTNPDLFGQDAAERALLDAARSGRLHHAWLLTGPKGVGKATLAFRFARYLLAGGARQDGLFGDAGPESLYLDPEHPVFRRVAAGGHADLMVVDRSTNPRTGKLRTEITADDTRPLKGFLHLTAAEGGWRIAIVDNAEAMNAHAANALLKPLEEPPSDSLILIITNAPGRILPTIRSRCRQLVLPPVSPEGMAAVLGARMPDATVAERELLVGLADGSPGRAIALRQIGGVEIYRDMLALLGTLPELNSAALHGFCERLARPTAAEENRLARDLFARLLAQVIRVAATQGRAQPDRHLGLPEEGDTIARLAAGLVSPYRATELWDEVTTLFGRAEPANLDRKQVLLSAFLALANAMRRTPAAA